MLACRLLSIGGKDLPVCCTRRPLGGCGSCWFNSLISTKFEALSAGLVTTTPLLSGVDCEVLSASIESFGFRKHHDTAARLNLACFYSYR